ncbi:MAG TPA: M23 family metallopeptidase [Caldisericia bacterium]|nr:M23 family metallopeptidase [Caldisericia bacterium]HPB33837.1 M23 family metallopeptidase [Caldisericia bacterium]HQL66967.1 M23 family metallopeptidase [Caldisericia bacterium]HQN47930.1 M23 family metallopeptidase [Caldisericia bacterium]HQO99099.1 M23 family metallopeptidase [Caldisericia bacterium]
MESRSSPGGSVSSNAYARVSVNGGSGGFVYNPFYWCNFHSVPGYYFDYDNDGYDYRGGTCVYDGHTGTDYTCSTGTYLYAGFTGVVIKVIETVPNNDHTIREGWPWGNYIKICRSEDTSWQILYTHLASNSVIPNEGNNVNAGQKVAQSDNTGNSNGSHLHFELIQNGTPKDPYLYGCYFIQDPRGCSYCESGCHSSPPCP